MKIISYSLWGRRKLYCQGLLDNIAAARELYPDWQIRVYFDSTAPTDVIGQVLEAGHKAILMPDPNYNIIRIGDRMGYRGNSVGALWRFLAVDAPEAEVVICRDTDSILSLKERAAVEEWLRSSKGFHTMHDAEAHRQPMLAGMWGVKAGRIVNMGDKIYSWGVNNRSDGYFGYGSDEDFLHQVIWPLAKNDCLRHSHKAHDAYGPCKVFPIHNGFTVGSQNGEVVI